MGSMVQGARLARLRLDMIDVTDPSCRLLDEKSGNINYQPNSDQTATNPTMYHSLTIHRCLPTRRSGKRKDGK